MILRVKDHLDDTLHLNTYILLTIRLAVIGFSFLFWALAARVVKAEAVGLASGTISAALLLIGLAQLGLGYALVHHLPTTNDPARLLNGSFLVAGLAGAVLAVIFLLGLEIWSPALSTLRTKWGASLIFILLVVSLVTSQLTNWAFLARRRPAFTLAKQVLQLASALLLLLGLSTLFKSYIAVTAAYLIAVVISLGAALFFFLPQVEPGYRFRVTLPAKLRSPLASYALVNHVADQLQRVPEALMALLAINVLGPETGAFFFVAWAMASGLLTLSASVSPALLAEGANRPQMVSIYGGKSFKLGLLLAMGLALAGIILGRPVLAIYGDDYVQKAYLLLVVLLASIVPGTTFPIYLSVLRVRNQLKTLVGLAAASMASGLLFAYLLMRSYGLLGAGLGWLLSRLLMAGCVFGLWRLQSRRSAG